MERALIVAAGENSVVPLAQILLKNAISEIKTASHCAAARRLVEVRAFDLCVVNTPLSDEFGDKFAADMVMKGTQTILLVRADLFDATYQKLEGTGVFVLSKPLNKEVLTSCLRLAGAAEKQVRILTEQNRKLSAQLDDLRLISRAKCLLVQYLGMSERSAHKYIEKQAMDMRMTKVAVARNILKTYEN